MVGVVLAGASLLAGLTGLRRMVHHHEHAHDGLGEHSHSHLHLPIGPARSHGPDAHEHAHTARSALRTAVVGAAFTLSPPLSMIAFLTALLPGADAPTAGLAVVAYAAAIVTTMTGIGAGVGRGRSVLDRLHGPTVATAEVAASAAVLAYATLLYRQVAAL